MQNSQRNKFVMYTLADRGFIPLFVPTLLRQTLQPTWNNNLWFRHRYIANYNAQKRTIGTPIGSVLLK